jgi:hypothetical protein
MPAENATPFPDFGQLICIGFASGLLSSELYANLNNPGFNKEFL